MTKEYNLMSDVKGLELDTDYPPGTEIETASGGVFVVQEGGKAVLLKGCGCVGCDAGFLTGTYEGKVVHYINHTDIMYCVKPDGRSKARD